MPEVPDSPASSAAVVSMTGTGVASGETEFGNTVVELRSVNGRTLSVKQRLASAAAGVEATIERAIQGRIRRGTVSCVVEVAADPTRRVALDREALAAWHAALQEAAAGLGLGADLTLRDLLGLPGVVASAGGDSPRTSRPAGRAFTALLHRALDALLQDRERDGAATAAAILEQIDRLSAARAAVELRAPQSLADYRARLLHRVNEFLAEHGRPAEQEVVLREVAIYADRVDANEELQRIGAHLDRARALLADGGEIGRALEFLMQELLREVNTLGSKTQDVEIAHTVVAMKGCIDRLRELVANLE